MMRIDRVVISESLFKRKNLSVQNLSSDELPGELHENNLRKYD